MTEETTAPAEGITDDTATNEAVDSVNTEVEENNTEDASHTLLGTDDPMLKVPDKFLNDQGEPDYEKLTKSYNNLEKMKGPISAAPENVEGYALSEDIADMYEGNDLEGFRARALEQGISNDHMNFFLTEHAGAMEEFEYSPDKGEAELKEAWGDDEYVNNIHAASNALDALESLGVTLDSDEVTGNIPLIKALAAFNKEMQQDSPSIKPSAENPGTEDRLNELMASSDYWVKDSDTRIEADKILQSLYG